MSNQPETSQSIFARERDQIESEAVHELRYILTSPGAKNEHKIMAARTLLDRTSPTLRTISYEGVQPVQVIVYSAVEQARQRLALPVDDNVIDVESQETKIDSSKQLVIYNEPQKKDFNKKLYESQVDRPTRI